MRDVSKLRVAMLGGTLVAVLALAGCGGSSHSASASPTTTTPTTAATGAGRFAALRTCLQQHGITLPQRTPRSTTPGETFPRRNGGGGGGFGGGGAFLNPPAGVSQAQFQSALKACGAGNGAGGLNSSALAAYRSCLADHGVKLPAQGTNSGSTTPSTINRNDPTVAAAMKTCAPLLPAGIGRGRNASTTTTAPAS